MIMMIEISTIQRQNEYGGIMKYKDNFKQNKSKCRSKEDMICVK